MYPTDLKFTVEVAGVTPIRKAVPSPAFGPSRQRTGILFNSSMNQPILVLHGMMGFELFSLQGRKIWGINHLKSGATFGLPEGLRQGTMKYRWISGKNGGY